MVMPVEAVTLDRDEARRLYLEYQEHRQYSDAEDRLIARTYREIAAGRVVIKALESIRLAGLGADRLPKLALVRAGAEYCYIKPRHDASAVMQDKAFVRPSETRHYIDFPPGTFPGIDNGQWNGKAMVPLIPVKLRPRKALTEYHILFEAEWAKVVPKDPMLLRRIGEADLWTVCGAWDLTEVERAVLATRLNG